MATHTPLQQLKEAKQIAKDHRMFIAEKKERAGTLYLLYRAATPRNIFLGKRVTPSGIRTLVSKCANFR
jgi:hypothetical protein